MIINARGREISVASDKIGHGAYGTVREARIDGKLYALKKFNEDCKYGVPPSAIREVDCYKKLAKHPNIVEFEMLFVQKHRFYILMEHGGICVYKKKVATRVKHLIKSFAHQLIGVLADIHRIGIVHRDISACNVLMRIVGKNKNARVFVKLCDFGCSRVLLESNSGVVCTSSYRAPEVFSKSGIYNEKIDIWGAACVIYEFIMGKQLVRSNHIDTVEDIFKVIGTPSKSVLEKLGLEARQYRPTPFLHKIVEIDRNLADLICNMLVVDPDLRPSAAELLKHKYFTDMPEHAPFVARITPMPKRVCHDLISRRRIFELILAYGSENGASHTAIFNAMELFDFCISTITSSCFKPMGAACLVLSSGYYDLYELEVSEELATHFETKEKFIVKHEIAILMLTDAAKSTLWDELQDEHSNKLARKVARIMKGRALQKHSKKEIIANMQLGIYEDDQPRSA